MSAFTPPSLNKTDDSGTKKKDMLTARLEGDAYNRRFKLASTDPLRNRFSKRLLMNDVDLGSSLGPDATVNAPAEQKSRRSHEWITQSNEEGISHTDYVRCRKAPITGHAPVNIAQRRVCKHRTDNVKPAPDKLALNVPCSPQKNNITLMKPNFPVVSDKRRWRSAPSLVNGPMDKGNQLSELHRSSSDIEFWQQRKAFIDNIRLVDHKLATAYYTEYLKDISSLLKQYKANAKPIQWTEFPCRTYLRESKQYETFRRKQREKNLLDSNTMNIQGSKMSLQKRMPWNRTETSYHQEGVQFDNKGMEVVIKNVKQKGVSRSDNAPEEEEGDASTPNL